MTDAAVELSKGPHDDDGAAAVVGLAMPAEGPPRVDVLAVGVADVVVSAGGWLFDRARSGWAVTVFLPTEEDVRPLHILGIKAFPLQRFSDELPRSTGRPHTVAASSAVVDGDRRARANVSLALRRAPGRVIVWGDPRPGNLGNRFGALDHQLSVAAVAFKKQALRSVGIDSAQVEPTERFRGRLKGLSPCDSDLVPTMTGRRGSPGVDAFVVDGYISKDDPAR